MGQLLAQKQAAAAAATAAGATASAYAATAQVKAGEAMDQAGVMAASAKQQIIKGVHRAKNITPEEKAKLLSRASTVLTIASIVCPAGRVAKIGGKVVMACVSTPFACTRARILLNPSSCRAGERWPSRPACWTARTRRSSSSRPSP